MEIAVLVWSLKSSILSWTSLQMDKTFWGVVSAAVVEKSRRRANMVARGDGKFGPWGWPQDPSYPKKKCVSTNIHRRSGIWSNLEPRCLKVIATPSFKVWNEKYVKSRALTDLLSQESYFFLLFLLHATTLLFPPLVLVFYPFVR